MKIVYSRPFLNGELYEPPLGIAHLAAYVREKLPDIEQEVFDLDVVQFKKNRIVKELKQVKPDICCVSVFSYNRFEGFELAKMAREAGAFVIIGGQHTTFMDKDTLENLPFIDLVIRGEAEATLVEFLKRFKNNEPYDDVAGISFRNKKGEVVRNPDREFIDITNISMPAYDLFPMARYKYYGVMGGRGCPYNCNFCGSPQFWKRKLRLRDPHNVVDEIEHLVKMYGKKIVHMKDDVFTFNKQWAKDVCNEIIRRKLDIQWECLTRVNLVDEETLKVMKQSGCNLIEFGIESGSNDILKVINKASTLDLARKAVKLTREAGIRYGTFFMIGHPGETEQTLEDTFNFALELRGDAITFTLTDAIPGTELHELAIKEKNIPKNFVWSKSDKRNLSGYPVPRFQNKHLPESMMMEYSRRFLMRFAFGRLFDLKDERDFEYLFKNEYVPYHITVKSMKDARLFFSELKEGIKCSSSIKRRMKGFALLPIFISRLSSNHLRRLYRKTKVKLRAFDGRIHEETQKIEEAGVPVEGFAAA